MAEKSMRYFRAVKSKRGDGPLAIEHSRDNHTWSCPMTGLDESYVRSEFTKLKRGGAIIVDTPEYQHAGGHHV